MATAVAASRSRRLTLIVSLVAWGLLLPTANAGLVASFDLEQASPGPMIDSAASPANASQTGSAHLYQQAAIPLGTYGNIGLGGDQIRVFDTVLSQAEILAVAGKVPEPSTILLLGLGLVGLATRRSRRKLHNAGIAALLVAVAMTAASSADAAVTGLVANWKLDETVGTIGAGSVIDSAAVFAQNPGYNGTPTGVTFDVAGAYPAPNTAADFNGTTDRIAVGYNSALNSPSFTYTTWARVDGGASHRAAVTSRNSSPANTFQGFILYALPSDTNWSFWTGDDTNNQWDVLNGPAVTSDLVHLAISFDDATNTKSIYVNGVLSNTTTGDTYDPNTSTQFNIGAGADTGNQFHFNGLLDDAAFFNRALTLSEIQLVMDLGAFRAATIPEPSTVLLLGLGLVGLACRRSRSNRIASRVAAASVAAIVAVAFTSSAQAYTVTNVANFDFGVDAAYTGTGPFGASTTPFTKITAMGALTLGSNGVSAEFTNGDNFSNPGVGNELMDDFALDLAGGVDDIGDFRITGLSDINTSYDIYLIAPDATGFGAANQYGGDYTIGSTTQQAIGGNAGGANTPVWVDGLHYVRFSGVYSTNGEIAGTFARILGQNHTGLAGIQVVANAVPEPSSIALLGLGLVGIACRRSRRNR